MVGFLAVPGFKIINKKVFNISAQIDGFRIIIFQQISTFYFRNEDISNMLRRMEEESDERVKYGELVCVQPSDTIQLGPKSKHSVTSAAESRGSCLKKSSLRFTKEESDTSSSSTNEYAVHDTELHRHGVQIDAENTLTPAEKP